LIRFGQKSKSCIPKNIRFPTAIFVGLKFVTVLEVFAETESLKVYLIRIVYTNKEKKLNWQ